FACWGGKRYQQEGHLHFITFSCYRRLPFLKNDPARICSKKSPKPAARSFTSTSTATPHAEHVHLVPGRELTLLRTAL
ncbi:MAG TPA: hypothetical protein VKV02_04695, partial [Acidobacteriaceae bacterium]|nr:hypothetical protein [Acidobacteriaceae bacterium]